MVLGGLAPSRLEAEPGKTAGAVSLVASDGNELVVKNFNERAATVFLFLSARSDAVERTVAPINGLYRKYRRRRVLFVGVCPNGAESPQELRDFAQKRGLIFGIYRDPQGRLARQWGVKAVPAAVLVDRSGTIIRRGGVESQELLSALDAAIGGASQPRGEAAPVRPTPIDEPGSLRNQPNPYGSLIFSSELVFEKIPGAPAHHCSTIAETPRGDLLCLWYGGSYESADDQTLYLARRPKGSRSWTTPQPLIRNAEHPPGNGVLFVDGRRRIWIVWCRMESARPRPRGSGWNNCRLMYRTSTDDGLTWTADREFLGDNLRAVPRNPALRLSSGALVLAVEAYLSGRAGSAFLIGTDGGNQWEMGGFTGGGSQPALIERADRSILALLRGAPRLMQTESRDGGRTWSDAVPSKIRNPDAGISMTRLESGHLVLVFNDSDRLRTPLSVARSLDEGRRWETPLSLESNPGEYSYPCVIQTSDGRIHVSYTFRRYSIKHVEFNEDWLVHTERPN